MLADLQTIFVTKTRSLEILYCLRDLKAVVRLDANDSELQSIEQFCKDHSLSISVSDFKVIKITDDGKGMYSNRVLAVDRADPRPGLVHVYISKDANKTQFLKVLEQKNDDRAVGELLGYPKPCIDFFESAKKEQKKVQNDFLLPAYDASPAGPYCWMLNYGARYFDYTLLSHFPHDLTCKESLAQAKERFALLEKEEPAFAKELKEMLLHPIIYTEREGVFGLVDATIDGNTITFQKVAATENNALAQQLMDHKQITVVDKKTIVIGKKNVAVDAIMTFADDRC